MSIVEYSHYSRAGSGSAQVTEATGVSVAGRDETRGWRKLAASILPASHRSTVNRILEIIDVGAVIPGTAERLRIDGLRTTASGTVVAVVGRGHSVDKRVVVKLPLNGAAADSLERNRLALLRLQSSPRTRDFWNLAPRIFVCGEVDARPFYIETFFPGHPLAFPVRRMDRLARINEMAASTILRLHTATAYREKVDEEVFEKLVASDIGVLRTASNDWPQPVHWNRQLTRLEYLLHALLIGRPITLSWTHGDYWSGNLLLDESDNLTGIIDWDRSCVGDVPLLDIFHLLVYTRRLDRRTKPGEEIVSYLVPWLLTSDDRRIVDVVLEQLSLPVDRDFLLACALLYWIRFAARNVSRYSSLRTNAQWLAENVYHVLEHCVR